VNPGVALFPFTPAAVDRRKGACLSARYEGDPRYVATTSPVTCITIGPAITALDVSVGPSTTYTLGAFQTLTATLTWPDSVGIVGRTVNVSAENGAAIATITLTPDPTGKGIATGSAQIKLPFQAGILTFTYPQSGDLALAQKSIKTTMSPVSTTMQPTARSPVTNPFSVLYNLRLNTGGVPLPPGTSVGGTVQFFDGSELLGTTNIAPLPPGPGITDGTSNTINFSESATLIGGLGNIIRPLGTRTIRVRFTGSALFAASEGTVTVTVQ
jgi:hypothetical protein